MSTLAFSAIGRQQYLAELIHQLPGCRLITVTGLGGMGKTYLAVEAAIKIDRNRDFLHGVS